MPRSFWEEWLYGPHDYEKRSRLSRLAINIVNSREWEYIFLLYIVFNAAVKLTKLRVLPDEYEDFLVQTTFYACIIFTIEWLIELFTLGTRDFFGSTWYLTDTVVNVLNWTSFFVELGVITKPLSNFLPNIAFIRMLRFLKPLARVEFLFASKVVVKTVAGAMASMGPVLALVGFVVLLFGVAGIYIFGRDGGLFYRCGVPVALGEALDFYDPLSYENEPLEIRGLNIKNCSVDMARYA
eukprot:CAMPEP_0172056502 /NCGR_PEP_ID=MMETSP1043-20130122/5829_1 /TAXON_ID=464988 /ORGANISM="Hemiselmis andersenii, Strain CCMP441" /LENGTH=238 /DNA_ID=CAMNT_0012715933 /DNA_START=145 /DNA_END=858 /DNA_ORIENTATION=+